MEATKTREEKVKTLITKITDEYEKRMGELYNVTYFNCVSHNPEPSDSGYKEFILDIANEIVILNWVKINIIDKEGSIFKSYFRYDSETDEAIFMVSDTEIEMMINSNCWIDDFENTFYNHTTHLDDIDARCIGKLMYTYFDRALYEKGDGKTWNKVADNVLRKD